MIAITFDWNWWSCDIDALRGVASQCDCKVDIDGQYVTIKGRKRDDIVDTVAITIGDIFYEGEDVTEEDWKSFLSDLNATEKEVEAPKPRVVVSGRVIPKERIVKAMAVLENNGIDSDEVERVLGQVGYALLDVNLFP